MYRNSLIIISLVLVFSCSNEDSNEDAQLICPDFQLQGGVYDTAEDFKIFNAVSQPYYEVNGQVHLSEQTEHYMSKESVAEFLDSSEIVYNQEALNNYGLANEVSANFKNSPSPENITLIGFDELTCFFYDNFSIGWEGFYKKYPDSYGLLSFSKPGYSSDGNAAILLRYRTNGRVMHLGGADFDGSILLLSKINGVWHINESLVFVVS